MSSAYITVSVINIFFFFLKSHDFKGIASGSTTRPKTRIKQKLVRHQSHKCVLEKFQLGVFHENQHQLLQFAVTAVDCRPSRPVSLRQNVKWIHFYWKHIKKSVWCMFCRLQIPAIIDPIPIVLGEYHMDMNFIYLLLLLFIFVFFFCWNHTPNPWLFIIQQVNYLRLP